MIVTVLQLHLKNAVTQATKLLLYDPNMFVVPLPVHSEDSHHRHRLSAQFSAMAPKVINYDPQKPIAAHRRSSKQLDLASTISVQILSSTSGVRYHSSRNIPTALDQLDVSFSFCTLRIFMLMHM